MNLTFLLQKSECPPEILTHNAISVCIEGQEVWFLLENDNIVTAPIEIVESALPQIDNCKIKQHLLNKCNLTLTVNCKNDIKRQQKHRYSLFVREILSSKQNCFNLLLILSYLSAQYVKLKYLVNLKIFHSKLHAWDIVLV